MTDHVRRLSIEVCRIDESISTCTRPGLLRHLPLAAQPRQGSRLICDVHDPDGKPFVGDPRHVLKRALKRAEEMGFDAFNVGPEAEFFLFQTDDEGKPTTRTKRRGGYFDLGPLDHGEGTRREICMALEQMALRSSQPPRGGPGPARDRLQVRRRLRTADNIMPSSWQSRPWPRKMASTPPLCPSPSSASMLGDAH